VKLGADDVPLSVISFEAYGADPRPGDDVGSPLRDLVMCGAGLDTPGRTALGDAILAPGYFGAMDPRVARPFLLGSLAPCPACRLGAGGGQHGVRVFAGHR
jgi:hypothetical protein